MDKVVSLWIDLYDIHLHKGSEYNLGQLNAVTEVYALLLGIDWIQADVALRLEQSNRSKIH